MKNNTEIGNNDCHHNDIQTKKWKYSVDEKHGLVEVAIEGECNDCHVLFINEQDITELIDEFVIIPQYLEKEDWELKNKIKEQRKNQSNKILKEILKEKEIASSKINFSFNQLFALDFSFIKLSKIVNNQEKFTKNVLFTMLDNGYTIKEFNKKTIAYNIYKTLIFDYKDNLKKYLDLANTLSQEMEMI